MFGSANQPAAPKDFEVAQPPTDGISCLAFSSQSDLLAASSFDNQTRIWQINGDGSSAPKASIQHEAPSLGCAWSKDGTKLLSVGADKAGRVMDINTGQTQQAAGHDAPIKCCRWFDGGNMGSIAVTASWDKTVRYWDLRSQNPVATLNLPERAYSMDVVFPLMVVATAEKHVMIYNLTNPTVVYKQTVSPLKWQTRVVSCFTNANGFAIGSIEGRVGIHYVEDKDASYVLSLAFLTARQNFSFKCHRDDEKKNVFAVNDISFHPNGTFSTAGADGGFNFWDKDAKCRLKPFPLTSQPISCTAFNKNGSIFAYASSYDWSKGHEFYTSQMQNKIMLHAVKEEDVKPRPPKGRK